WRAETVAREFAAKGAPVVIVNPSAPVGPRDVKPTPTGQVLVDFLNRKMPAYLDTGLNWVHVRDVAIGHILAAEKGKVGERYILGSAEGNWTMKEAFGVLEQITGVRAPRMQIPTASHGWLPTSMNSNRNLPAVHRAPRWLACEWRCTRCSSTRPKRSANLASRKRHRNRH